MMEKDALREEVHRFYRGVTNSVVQYGFKIHAKVLFHLRP
jgi:hypothetical protein